MEQDTAAGQHIMWAFTYREGDCGARPSELWRRIGDAKNQRSGNTWINTCSAGISDEAQVFLRMHQSLIQQGVTTNTPHSTNCLLVCRDAGGVAVLADPHLKGK